jgi:hypothetical protein
MLHESATSLLLYIIHNSDYDSPGIQKYPEKISRRYLALIFLSAAARPSLSSQAVPRLNYCSCLGTFLGSAIASHAAIKLINMGSLH